MAADTKISRTPTRSDLRSDTSGSDANAPAARIPRLIRAKKAIARKKGDAESSKPNLSRLIHSSGPVATTLLMIAILLIGIAGYHFLPLSALPEVDYPTIQVQTFLPGASPEVMTSAVTAPLERQFGQMPGLNQMSSVSSAGDSVITLQFGLTLSLDIAEQEVQAAINAGSNLLPQTLPAPPVYAKVNPADAPILTLAITSPTLPLTATRRSRRYPHRPEDLAARRRRPRQHQRRPAAGGTRPGQSSGAGRAGPQHG